MEAPKHAIPKEVENIYTAWVFYRRIWWFCHYAIGISGVVAAITAANKPQFLLERPSFLNAVGWFSAVCMTTLTFLEPKKRARAYSSAWRILHKAIGNYRHSFAEPNPHVLFDAMSDGEDLIAKLDG
jgi:hypothetical protein